jgi:MAF protein
MHILGQYNSLNLTATVLDIELDSLMSKPHPTLILASSSPFRRELLSRLGIEFLSVSPDVDESQLSDESAEALVQRLAQDKARAIAESHPDALIIGSDQVATINGRILGKPGEHERAVEQLMQASGQRVSFLTGLCLLNSTTGHSQVTCEPFSVDFRKLSRTQIDSYLRREQPYNCAGAFKSEGLGITLFQRLQGDDPAALIGLPLIRLVDMLQNEGVDILAE